MRGEASLSVRAAEGQSEQSGSRYAVVVQSINCRCRLAGGADVDVGSCCEFSALKDVRHEYSGYLLSRRQRSTRAG